MKLTDMWIKYPGTICIVQYFFLLLCAVVAFTAGFFELDA